VTAGDLALAVGDIRLEMLAQVNALVHLYVQHFLRIETVGLIRVPRSLQPIPQECGDRRLGVYSTIGILQRCLLNFVIQTPLVDPINLDPSFILDPSEASSVSADNTVDFERVWDALVNKDSRGWCELSATLVYQRLRASDLGIKAIPADESPFQSRLVVDLVDGLILKFWGLGDLKIVLVSPTKAQAVLRLRTSDDESCLWWLRCGDDELQTLMKQFFAELKVTTI
jgi:hypothetical protein